MIKVAVIVGTRPEIIKMSPIIRELHSRKIDYFIIHSGQHYSYEMDKIFFEELNIPSARYNLEVGSGTHGKQIGTMLIKIEEVLLKEKPSIIFVQGDTNTVLAGAIVAAKLNIKVGHVEAGLRSYDGITEEINRVIADHVSTFLFAPTEKAKDTLIKEGISQHKIYVTGNPIVDSVFQNLEIANKNSYILKKLEIKSGEYFLITAHRAENVDVKENLINILNSFELLYNKFKIPLVYPIHPRTKKMLENFNLKIPCGIKLIEPLGFMDFLQLEANAKLILTDSGGVQEESCILKIPCVTLRESTERPETINVGANLLAGTDPKKIINCVELMLAKKRDWSNPFGDGKTSNKIIEIILSKLK